VNKLKILCVTVGVIAGSVLPASSALAANSGRPPVANFPNAEDRTPVIDVFVVHCRPGVIVFTPATQGHSPGMVNENCR